MQSYDPRIALDFIGGRGLALRFLWDETKPGLDSFSPQSKLIFAAGPLTGLVPNSGKLVVAAKSPLTGGYGDGNIGSRAAVQLRKVGLDALIVSGKASKISYLYITDDRAEILGGEELVGLGSFEVEKRLQKKHGKNAGLLSIGPAGERLVRYATIVSQRGRSGGRPGMGAVMGSKNLKAIVIEGSREISVADKDSLDKLRSEAYRTLVSDVNYKFWMRQSTLASVEWAQANGVLPTFNFREGVFEWAGEIGGAKLESLKASQKGCPLCNMVCGAEIRDHEGTISELDYENVAMLGSNLGISDLRQIAVLNRLCDDYGIDTISAGNVIGFLMESYEKKFVKERVEWGDYQRARTILEDIVHRRGLGNSLAEGVKRFGEKIGRESLSWSMNVKGLEVSAFNCHSTPGMALAYATSPIGAHHKDGWIITWEVKLGKDNYDVNKVEKVIESQRIRGGIFEILTVCRFPYGEMHFELEWYLKFLRAATGAELSLDHMFLVADRIYSLLRAFWVREYGNSWSRDFDTPPMRWFSETPTKGPYRDAKLDRGGYNRMLDWYYERRGWDQRGIPRKTTLKKLGLGYVAGELERYIRLTS